MLTRMIFHILSCTTDTNRSILPLLFLFIAFPAAAQYTVVGKAVQANGEPVEMATVRIMKYQNGDSTLISGAQADLDGVFALTGIPQGRYTLVVSSIGFKTMSKAITLPQKEGETNTNVGTIRLEEDVQMLAAVDVKGQAAEMTVKGDTIEYNTSAYKVQDGAMVEELLKKMNGVEVDKEGNVTVNGESITAVRIDGKKFFGSDVQSATKNIPAEMIEKIQVIDEKSDMAKLTGFEDDETERIINLTTKKDRKRGVFGNYTGGLGADFATDNNGWFNYGDPEYGKTAGEKTLHFFANDFRYNANLFTNILLGESQTTIIGSANNTNEIRSGRGRSSFGSQNQGITWSEGLGINTNIDLTHNLNNPKTNVSLLFGGDGQMNHSYNDTHSYTNKESYSNGITYYNNDSTSQQTKAWDGRVRIELEYQIDSMNKLILKPNWSLTDSRYTQFNLYDNLAGDEAISSVRQTRYAWQQDITASLQAIYNRKFLKPGRTLTINGEAGITDSRGTGSSNAYDLLNLTTLVDQNTVSRNNAYNYNVKASFVEPLYNNRHFLEVVAQAAVFNHNSSKNQYTGQNQAKLDSAYSNTFINDFFSETAEVNYRYVSESIDLTAGLKVNPSQTRSRTTYMDTGFTRDTTINVWNFAPNFNFKYKFGKKKFARIIYKGTSQQPTISQLEPVRNNSNAMNETVGNLQLNPAFNHTFRFMYSRFNQENFSSLMGGIRATLTKDALVSNSIYDETGKLYQQTVNADQTPWSVGGDFMFNIPFAQKRLQLNSRTALNYNQRVAYVSREQSAAEIAAEIASNSLRLGALSQTGNLQVQENLSLRFTHDIVDVGVKGDFTYSRTENTLRATSLSNVIKWSVTGDVAFHLPRNWTIAADCSYTDRYGYKLDDVSELSLNAHITKSWTNATLKLSAFDLLNNEKSIVQVVGDNYVQYQKFNTLPMYAMLTFTYKLNRMGNLKATGKAARIQEIIESGENKGPMPGTPPQGPPPER